jgi:hypothetical protein
MAEPAAQTNQRNGGLELKTPFGSVAVAGRDIMLLVMLGVLGVAAVAVQVYTMRNFEKIVVWGFEDIKAKAAIAAVEREQMLSAIRIRMCLDVFVAQMGKVEDETVRASLQQAWRELCVRK